MKLHLKKIDFCRAFLFDMIQKRFLINLKTDYLLIYIKLEKKS
jgi:hypothetical protein